MAVNSPAWIMFPVSLAEQLVRTFSQEGDTVLDPFCGSGQTLLVSKACERDFRGMTGRRGTCEWPRIGWGG